MNLDNTYFTRLPKEISEMICKYFSNPNVHTDPFSNKKIDYTIITFTTNQCDISIEIRLPTTLVTINKLINDINDFLNNKTDNIKWNTNLIETFYYNEKYKRWIFQTGIGSPYSCSTFCFNNKDIVTNILSQIKTKLENLLSTPNSNVAIPNLLQNLGIDQVFNLLNQIFVPNDNELINTNELNTIAEVFSNSNVMNNR